MKSLVSNGHLRDITSFILWYHIWYRVLWNHIWFQIIDHSSVISWYALCDIMNPKVWYHNYVISQNYDVTVYWFWSVISWIQKYDIITMWYHKIMISQCIGFEVWYHSFVISQGVISQGVWYHRNLIIIWNHIWGRARGLTTARQHGKAWVLTDGARELTGGARA